MLPVRNVVQTAPPYPGDRRSASPSRSSIQEDHIRKKARLEYESSTAIVSPSIGGYDPQTGRFPGYIPSNYNWQAHPSYNQYNQPSYGVPASAPPLRDSHGMHAPTSSAMTDNSEGGYPSVSAEFPTMHQSTRSTGSVSSPGSQNYARATAQGNAGYQSYSSLPHQSSSYSTGPTSLGPPGGMALSESPQLSQHHDSRTWSHAYGVSAALSPNPNLPVPMMPRQAPISRSAQQIDQSSAYYSRSYPPYDERSLPVGMVTSPYQQSAPQFLSPESSGPSVFRGDLPYPSAGSSAPRAAGSASSSSNQTGSKSQALFVSKLYNMLEDPEIVASGLLKWSADGQGFVCSDPNEFARYVQPRRVVSL